MARKTPEVGTRDLPLKWEVFVPPGIPTVTNDLPPGTKQQMWSPTSSTLIYGKRDAVLVDPFITVKQADALVDWVAESGKNSRRSTLRAVTATISLASERSWDRFPNARAIATRDVVKLMRQQASPDVVATVRARGFPQLIPKIQRIA
jgi:hypothetical protein